MESHPSRTRPEEMEHLKRLLRIIFTTVELFAGLLLIVSLTLFIRSFYVSDCVLRVSEESAWAAETYKGKLYFSVDEPPILQERQGFEYSSSSTKNPIFERYGARPRWRFFGFSFEVLGGGELQVPVTKRLGAPIYPAMALSLVLLLPFLLQVRRTCARWNRRRHLRCETCGYDIRSSRDRCPECGMKLNSQGR